jgi:Tc toxin complex TcA C-terminal TcB-binding domain
MRWRTEDDRPLRKTTTTAATPRTCTRVRPWLLVRAQAAGVSIGEILDAGAAARSNYRFAVMLQKANELTSETRSLASALLSALGTGDAEALALLRSRQETTLLTAVRDNRQKQLAEAEEQVAALQESRRSIEARRQFYESRAFQNAHETTSLELAATSQALSATSATLRHLAGRLAAIGALKIGAPSTSGYEVGPDYIARSLEADAGSFDALASRKNAASQRASRLGDFSRRKDEWDLQLDLATIELVQIDRQLAAADIRLAIAERELQNHELQTEHSRETDRFMREKFTNADLFGWMVGQISALYFQAYQLAFDLARRAERCLQFELGEQDGQTSYIRFGYWDSLKKGLMAGDQLAHDLKRLELAHLEKNARKYELTKHVSLATLDPIAFITLKESGKCDGVRIPEALFDLETPGHYLRCLKSVSVTIPCVTGPYTGVHCKVQLTSNEIRWDGTAPTSADGYARIEPDDSRFVVDRQVVQAIVTSSGQADTGLFEANLNDERYLPFEGAGAISTWSLELPADFRSFDYDSISDGILHLRDTAREGGEALKTQAAAATRQLVGQGLLRDGASPSDQRPLARLISLRHEFPSELHRLTSDAATAGAVTLDVAQARFPYFVQGKEITIKKATASVRTKDSDSLDVSVAPGEATPPASPNPWTGEAAPGLWTVAVPAPSEVEDLFLILEYGAS